MLLLWVLKGASRCDARRRVRAEWLFEHTSDPKRSCRSLFAQIKDHFWCPTEMTVTMANGDTEIITEPLPPPCMPLIFDNSQGFMYEATEVSSFSFVFM